MKNLTRFRYYLELISVPVFAFLVIHLSGHGLMLLKEAEHEHHQEISSVSEESHHEEELHEEESVLHAEEEGHEEHAHEHFSILDLDFWLSTEFLGGLLGLIFFTWVWHQKPFKRLVPCSHDHCHHKTVWPHLLASAAFVFHWFPESRLRYELLNSFSVQDFTDILAALGFLSHFLVDIIVLLLLVTFWPKRWQKSLAFGLLLGFWVVSFWVGEKGGLYLAGLSEPVVLLISAFLLTMFVHKPHKPQPECHTCEH